MLIKEQIGEIDRKKNRRVLDQKQLSYPKHSRDFSFLWYFYFSQLGDIGNYSKPSRIIKFAGVAPYHYESSQYNAHTHCHN